ncbi:MAG: hypothetical protein DCC75_02905 [Proteobacteria bacterium]|nr:MAG: hypothetical protein DCC75_02905 [Pseudomonadota bacterium]
MSEPKAASDLSQERVGELLVILGSITWGLFPVLTKLSFYEVPPLFSAACCTLFSTPLFAYRIWRRKLWGEYANPAAWKGIAAAATFIGVFYYGLTFIGLKYTSAGKASLVLLMEIFFTFVLLHVWGVERNTRRHLVGGVAMVIGASFVLFPGEFRPQTGDLIVLAACLFPPVGNHLVKEARRSVSTENLLLGRAAISGVIFMLISVVVEDAPSRSNFQKALPGLLINGLLLFGLTKIWWLEAIHRINISKAIALGAVSPAFTLLFAYLMLDEVPTWWHLIGFVPMLIGVWLLTSNSRSQL